MIFIAHRAQHTKTHTTHQTIPNERDCFSFSFASFTHRSNSFLPLHQQLKYLQHIYTMWMDTRRHNVQKIEVGKGTQQL